VKMDEYAGVRKAACDRRSVEQHGGGDRALSSARRWTRMIVDGRGGAEVWCWESHEDHRPGEYVSRGHGRAS
jgi:hypothetical protein